MDVFNIVRQVSMYVQCDEMKQQFFQCIRTHQPNSSSCTEMYHDRLKDKCGSSVALQSNLSINQVQHPSDLK